MDRLVLLALVTALAAGAVGMVWRRLRRAAAVPAPRSPAPTAGAAAPDRPVGCPTCRRPAAAGARFCSYDGRALVPLAELDAGAAAGSVTCRVCRRAFDAATRYCPFDAEELGPPVGGLPPPVDPSGPVHLAHGAKICPHCTERYASDESFCGRDGAALVAVN